MKQKKIPLRKCTGCGEMKPKAELVRVVKSPAPKTDDNNADAQVRVSLDLTGKLPGRGAYVCKNTECIEKAIKAKRFERAFGVKIPDEIYDAMKREMEENE